MSRSGGSARADIDTAYYDDPKVRRLWRIVEPDVALMCECLVVHEATVLATWREGRRVTVAEAVPIWLPIPRALTDPLVEVGLLDAQLRVPVKSWRGWIEEALGRIAAVSEAGRKAGIASGASRRRTVVERSLNGRSSDGERSLNPTVPTVPTVPYQPSVPADTEDDGRADLEAFLEVRYRAPTAAQRRLMDSYCQTFDLTGPDRAARLILSHPDDPIGALKADLAAFREQRRAEAAASEEPKPRPRRGVLNPETQRIARLMREQDEQRERERADRMLAAQAGSPVPSQWEAAHRANLVGLEAKP